MRIHPVAVLCALAAAAAAQGPAPAALWSFAPLAAAAPPATGDEPWDAHPIDRFVRARQLAAGIEPNPLADRRTLLRRASFALCGLPPTPTALAAFAADPSPDAFEKAIDALLGSPHYGERQARHWLDLARYSDSNGLDENLAFGAAFRYRDWVVRAHNADVPYDRFGAMQVAGDLLAGDPAIGLDGHVATGFLALGPRMLAEQDKEKLVLDTVDEQLDLVGRTFLGLTLGCARCHDHKFDPVSARDYYALAGIFRSTKSFHELGHVSKWYDRELADDTVLAARKAAGERLAAAESALQQAEAAAAREQRRTLAADAGRYLLASTDLLAQSLYVQAESAARTNLATDDRTWGSADCVVLHTHQDGPQYAEWDLQAKRPGRHRLDVRFAAQQSRPMRVLLDGVVVAERAFDATTGGWHPQHQQWHAGPELDLGPGPHVLRCEAIGPHTVHLDALLLSPLPLPLAADGLLPAAVRQAAAAMAAPAPAPLLALWIALQDAGSAGNVADLAAERHPDLAAVLLGNLPPRDRIELAARFQTLCNLAMTAADAAQLGRPGGPERLADPLLQAALDLLWAPGGLLAVPAAALRDGLPAATARELQDLAAARDERRRAVPAPAPVAICVADGQVVDLPVHLRGSHLTLGPDRVPRGVVAALAAAVPAPPMPTEHSGRTELAAWLFHPRQALAQRVAVNRIWQRAFGHGLVRSPSNFGARGDVPVHRELLDWLAADFVAHGWSQKHVWKRILLSRTWQQTADVREGPFQADPDNRLLWRQQRVRLEAEAVRDAMLFAAGTLDPTLGGTLLTTKDRDYVTNDQSNDAADYDRPRRSLYLPVIRNAMFDLFSAFDYCDSSVHLEQRPASAVATQALLLLNSPFVRAQSSAFAARAAAAAGDDDARIRFVWLQALGRAPSPSETDAAHRWLERARSGPAAGDALAGLCQTLFASNEFVYVD